MLGLAVQEKVISCIYNYLIIAIAKVITKGNGLSETLSSASSEIVEAEFKTIIRNYPTEQVLDTENNGAIVSAVYDQHGYETFYSVHPEIGVVTDITAPNDVVTYNEYNNSYTKLLNVTTDGTSVDYSYSGNRLNKIIYSGGGKNETYSFNYDDYGNVSKTMVGNQALSTNTYAAKNGALTTTTTSCDPDIWNPHPVVVPMDTPAQRDSIVVNIDVSNQNTINIDLE